MNETRSLQPDPKDRDRADALGWRTLTLYLVTAVGVVLCLLFMKRLLFPLTGALALGVVLDGPRKWLLRRMGPAAAATVLLVATTVAVVLPGAFLVKSVTVDAIGAVRAVRDGSAADALDRFTEKHHKIGPALQMGLDQLEPGGRGRQLAGPAAGFVGRGLRHFAAGITDVILMLFLLFFVLRDRDAAVEMLASLLPMRAEESGPFLERLGEVTHAIFLGRFLIAAVQGGLSCVAYWALGVPSPLLWGVLTALLCLVPAFGAFLAWVPLAIYLGLAGSWTKALLLALWGGVVISNLDNILYPMLVGRRIALPTAVVFVSIFGGVGLFGASGFVLGPLAVAATMLLLRQWRDRLDGASS